MLIEPYAMLNEAAHLEQLGVTDAMDRLWIDARCPVITPPQQVANRLRETSRGDAAHGTCGLGIGETMQDLIQHPELVIRAAELGDRDRMRRKLNALCDLKIEQFSGSPSEPIATTFIDRSWIEAALDNYAVVANRARTSEDVMREPLDAGAVIFEGAQGVLLDEWLGFHPHTTWSTTTFDNANALLDEAGFDGPRLRIGVLRSYFTRHGSGPLVTEDESMKERLPEPHNRDDGWQGRFRCGVFDEVAARYALAVVRGIDQIALTHVDRLRQLPAQTCRAYQFDGDELTTIPVPRSRDLAMQQQLTAKLLDCRPVCEPVSLEAKDFVWSLESRLATPIGIVSSGPTWREKVTRVVPQAVL
jgi:adenylosuccinate synthase